MRRWMAIGLAVVLLAVAGVASASVHDSWKILEPVNGTVVEGSSVTLKVDPGMVQVVAPGTPVDGQGHWHYLLDGQDVGKGPVNTFTFENLTPGQHTLRVELHQNDHSPYPDNYAQEVTITVIEPVANSWRITAPANGATISGSEVILTIDPGKVKTVPPGTVTPGEGHWHVLVDGKDVAKGPSNTFTIKDLTPGRHTISVELHMGDHSPYPGDTGQSVTINVGLPQTGGQTALYLALGALLLAAGAYLYLRRQPTGAQ